MPKEIKVTPAGELMWAKLLRPGINGRGTDHEKEQWSVDLLLSKADADAQAFVKQLKEAFIAAHGSTSKPGGHGLPWKTFKDDQGEETDLWQFSFKRNVTTKAGAELPPPVVTDAAGNRWPEDVLIGNGSSGKVAFTIWSWNNPEAGKGISLNLEAARVLFLVEYAPPDPTGAFGEPEQGYVLTGNEKRTAFSPAGQEQEPDEEEVPF